MKRLVAALLLATVLLSLLGTAGAEPPVTVTIDGKVQTLTTAPVIVNGTTLVPVRGIFENLGGTVAWDPVTRTATVTRDRLRVDVTVDNPVAQINGKAVTLAVPPQIVGGSTMVPLRVISEALGAEVRWHQETRTVEVTTRVGGTLTFAVARPNDLLPLYATDDPTISNLLFDSLFRHDDQSAPHPSLALRFTEEQEGLCYTFDLRPDVTWHDGTPFTARDVLFTIQTILHPGVGSPYAKNLEPLRGVPDLLAQYRAIDREAAAGKLTRDQAYSRKVSAWQAWVETGAVQATGEHSIRFELTRPDAPALTYLSLMPIISARQFERVAPDQIRRSPEALAPVGTGPYKLEAVEAGQITLTRNPDWRWGALGTRPRIQRVRFRYITPGDQHLLLLNGEADVASFPVTSMPLVERLAGFQVVPYYPGNYTFIGYDLTNPLFRDVRVRQAITHAIDREGLAKAVVPGGYGQVVHSHQVPGRWDYAADVPRFEYSPTRAEQLLDKAGWTRGADGIRQYKGIPLRFELATNDHAMRRETAQFIQQALAKVGIAVEIRTMHWDSYLDYIGSDEREAFLSGWTLSRDPDASAIFHSTGGWQRLTNINHPEVDRLLQAGLATTDLTLRRPVYQEFQRLVAREQLYTWLYRHPTLFVYHPRVKGIMTDRMGSAGPLWHIEHWYIEDAAD